MTNTPLVDVIIPVYNGERYLHEAIESVLKQRYHPLQLIVVDDGSEDESAALAARFEGVHVLHGPHAGIGAALNRGIRHGKGDLIAFLDADDRWLPEKLATGEMFAGAPGSGHGLRVRVSFKTFKIPAFKIPAMAHRLSMPKQAAVHRCAALVWRAAFERVGPFSESIVADFADWYARALEAKLHTATLPDVVFERRIHANNYGRLQRTAEHQGYLQAITRLTGTTPGAN
ncbi:MAG: glycosyltransferase family 2 protein [Caldilineaceae bacterium]